MSADGSSYEGEAPFRPREKAPLVARTFPVSTSLAGYPKRNGRHDLIAGVTVAALAIPSAMAYAELAGLSPVVGLYALLLPAVAYAFLGSSRQLVVGPEGALSLLVAVSVAPLAAGNPSTYAALAAMLGLLVGAIAVVGRIIRLGWVADYFSRSVLVGYLHGVAVVLVCGQLGKLFGVPIAAERAEQALVSVVCQAYVEGVSTRRVDDLVRAMGIDGMSKSQVSELAKNLDARVAEFRNRPLDAGPYTYVWLDALFHKVREGGRVVSVATVIATGVNEEGHREILGVDVFTTEDGAGWTAFLRGLVARGLSGVALVISDAHEGLKNAIAAVLPGASWQRCRTHAMRNLLTRVPKAAQSMVGTLVRTVFAQSDATQVTAQFARVIEIRSRS